MIDDPKDGLASERIRDAVKAAKDAEPKKRATHFKTPDGELKPDRRKRERIVLNTRAQQVAAQYAINAVSPLIIANVLRLTEFLGIAVVGVLIQMMYVVPQDGFSAIYPVASVVTAALTVITIQSVRGYEMLTLRRNVKQLSRVLASWFGIIAFLTTVAFFSRLSDDFSRVWFGSFLVTVSLLFIVWRSLVCIKVRSWAKHGKLERRAIIIGGGRHAEALLRELEGQRDSDIRICGIFDDRADDRSPAMVAGYPKLGTIPELVEFGRQARIDMLIVSLPLSAEKRIISLLRKVWVLPVDIRLSAHANQLRFRPRTYSHEGTVPFLDVFDKPIADWDAVLKRVFDVTFASLFILLFSPIMLATAIAVKLTSKGPIIFRQKRFGFNNELIDVYKFRSMYTEMTDHAAKTVVTKNDPRVTPVGRFIRRTSIDELPQLFNVLSGELSLVGPRPHAVNAHTSDRLWDEVIEGYFGRHKVKPGVTGWAQISGWRGEVDTHEKLQRRVEHDLYYIENWSVLFDLYICLATPIHLAKGENAY